jgi:hypothetical protein
METATLAETSVNLRYSALPNPENRPNITNANCDSTTNINAGNSRWNVYEKVTGILCEQSSVGNGTAS